MGCRIFIVGAPGAGKTTFATRIAARLEIPYHPLDPVAFVDERWTSRALGERQRMIAEIAEQPCWVAEGVHLGWTDPLVASADHIIWLDPPWWMLLWRASARHVSRRMRRWPPRPEVRALVDEGWMFVGRYYWQDYVPGMDLEKGHNLSRAATAATLAPWAAKVRHYRAPRVSEAAFAQLVAYVSRALGGAVRDLETVREAG